MNRAEAVAWLDEAARYFANRPTGGEDTAHWSNVANAEACGKIAALLADGALPRHDEDEAANNGHSKPSSLKDTEA